MLRSVISAITQIKPTDESYNFPSVSTSIGIHYYVFLVVCIDCPNFLIDQNLVRSWIPSLTHTKEKKVILYPLLDPTMSLSSITGAEQDLN